jgi:hypothetical protein
MSFSSADTFGITAEDVCVPSRAKKVRAQRPDYLNPSAAILVNAWEVDSVRQSAGVRRFGYDAADALESTAALIFNLRQVGEGIGFSGGPER